MAADTPSTLNNLVLYEIFVRNHTPEGTFAGVEADLERIRGLGVDAIWFMPIHPIGKLARKGSLGSPYSIRDYRAINPEYGTEADFVHLVQRAHELGLKVLIDVVYNHTAHDSVLVHQQPGWYHQDENGNPVTTVPAWSDVIDLLYPNQDLEEYLIESLCGWIRMGVDGFRCDVASIVPVSFWSKARKRVAEINPDTIWLAESVHANFVVNRRRGSLVAQSDSQLYNAFDLTYDYEIWPIWQKAVTGDLDVSRYLEMLRFQDSIYPTNYIKLRAVENHDTRRIMDLAPSPDQALAWTAFEIFNQGAFLLYAGQESGASITPSLFDKDPINWGEYCFQEWLKPYLQLKKDPAIVNGQFFLLEADPVIQATWSYTKGSLYGIFNVTLAKGKTDIRLPDGPYEEVITGTVIEVKNGRVPIPRDSAILRYHSAIDLTPVYSPLMDD